MHFLLGLLTRVVASSNWDEKLMEIACFIQHGVIIRLHNITMPYSRHIWKSINILIFPPNWHFKRGILNRSLWKPGTRRNQRSSLWLSRTMKTLTDSKWNVPHAMMLFSVESSLASSSFLVLGSVARLVNLSPCCRSTGAYSKVRNSQELQLSE